MLEVQSVSRHYGDFKAVSDVSFTVERGEIIGLLGHNGAGKTTIMKMLSGFLEPDSGDILFNQGSIIESPSKLQSQLGYLPENLPVYPELSVVATLDYAAELKGLRGSEKWADIKRVVQATELEDRLLAPVSTLSRGLKQRVGVAQAIIGSPSLLILDEPTNGLDPSQTEQMRALIRQISEFATVILSTHIMQEVEAVCDRALIIRRGELAVDAKLDELTKGQKIHLTSNGESAKIKSALADLPWLSKIELSENAPTEFAAQSSHAQWRLAVQDDIDIYQAIADCSNSLIAAGVPLMGIRPEVRDLQSLFLEVNTATAEVSNVA